MPWKGAVRTRTGLKPGEMVRVGTPHLAAVADDARVALPLLVRARLEQTESRRAAAESELIALRNSALLSRLRDLDQLLSGYDPEAYDQALQRLANGALLDELTEEARRRKDAVAVATDALQRSAATMREHISAFEALAPQRALLDEASRLQGILDGMESEALRTQSAARRAGLQLDEARGYLETLEQLACRETTAFHGELLTWPRPSRSRVDR